MTGTICAVCLSEQKGTPKRDVRRGELVANHGLKGDAHAGDWHRQVSLLSADVIDAFWARDAVPPSSVSPRAEAQQSGLGPERRSGEMDEPSRLRGGEGYEARFDAGAFGENLVVRGLDFRALPVGTRLRCGDALLQITQIGKECHHGCSIFQQMGDCIMPREGVFARVLRGGVIGAGDEMTVEGFRVADVTVSDRGFAGARADESGPLIAEMAQAAGYTVTDMTLVPDEREQIEHALRRLCDDGAADLVLTTGGTGFSPRDVTPEATRAVCDRMASGLAEALRQHSMAITKRAMFSRAVAGLCGRTLVVNLPGSPKAVRESLAFLLPELTHGLDILTGRDGECGGAP